MRIYDPRLGRFLSIDPLARIYPWYTPYQFAGNKPIVAIDLDGAEEAAPLNLNNPGEAAAHLTINSAYDVRNAITNSALRASSWLEKKATVKLLEKGGITDKSVQAELLDQYVARMVTIVEDAGSDWMGNSVQEVRREWALTAKNSAGKEFLAAALDVLTVASAFTPKGGTPMLFAKGAEVVTLSQIRRSFSLLYNVRRLSSMGRVDGLTGVHALEDVMEAGMAFVGKNAKKLYAESGRFIGWESTNGLKRFRPSAFKKVQGKFQANFEQRTSTDIKWDTPSQQGSRSNMHVDTDKGFNYNAERVPASSNSGN